jgi:hypothetical protein
LRETHRGFITAEFGRRAVSELLLLQRLFSEPIISVNGTARVYSPYVEIFERQ